MWLQSLEIKNYRSLEHVKLDNIQQFNVLIGRNNAGKSSVFGAVALVKDLLQNKFSPGNSLTAQDSTRTLELHLTFKASDKDREEFIGLLVAAGFNAAYFELVLKSSFLRQVAFYFKSPTGSHYPLNLYETKMRTQDGQWAVIQSGANPSTGYTSKFVDIAAASQPVGEDHLSYNRLHIEHSKSIVDVNFDNYFNPTRWKNDDATFWPLNRLRKYLNDAFFFSSFRHSTPALPVQVAPSLNQEGSNLAQVLHTLMANNLSKFEDIKRFVQAALPDIGQLQTPLRSLGQTAETSVDFISPYRKYRIPIHDMGGGIEQLLMVATVLLTTGDESTLFLEEPESHLHHGAQRFLIDQLYQGNRQVFITTHSPVFINLTQPHSLYQVIKTGERSNIKKCDDSSFEAVLEDIGARNSDVLLSDAVLFVEGPGDRDALSIWSKTLGKSLLEHNITVLPMGGGHNMERGAPMRSEILTGISQRAPVPHLFVLDHDERGKDELSKLTKNLGDRVIFLKARELENYLLIPRALLSAICLKHNDNQVILDRVKQWSEDRIKEFIHTTTVSLYNVVLFKRIRTRLGGMIGGFLPRELIPSLTSYAHDINLTEILLREIRSNVDNHLERINISTVVHGEQEILEKEWADPEQQRFLAPGEEIVSAVYREFGSEYRKTKDTKRIAKEMRQDEIAPEIVEIIEKAISLVDS